MAASTHHGSCHCGAVQFTVELDLAQPAVVCNCSICGRTGTMLLFVPASQFRLEKGEEQLTDYQFNRHVIHHLFCKTCGVKSFARGKDSKGGETIAVNVRALDGVDVFTQPTKSFDGKSH
jgi:hypothetical protein